MLRTLITLLALAASAQAADRPNIVFILCDDLGYGDIGAFGQQRIRTPNIDRLAAEGMKFTQHYSGAPVCAPSRCVLMTGKHPGHAYIRENKQAKALGLPFDEGQAPLPADTVTLPKLLQGAGYATGGFGKWGLGPVGSTGEPAKQGIARFFGYNCQAVAHNFYPVSLWSDSEQIALKNTKFAAHQKLPADADVNAAASYAGFTGNDYAPDLISQQALNFVRENKERPFLLYYATTVPHLALQVPADSLAEYEGKFPETPYPGGRGYLPNRTPRATYAAMITRLDREVGRIAALVAELGLDEKTVFIFTSDNGPLYDELGGTDTEFFDSAGGLRGRKGGLYEGGIRVPCIVRWKGKVAAGSTSDRVTGFEDWMPTLLDLAGLAAPSGVDGISFAPTLRGEKQDARPFLYRETPGYGGQQSVRVGDWKAVRQKLNPGPNAKLQPGAVELYDLAKDRAEATDVAPQNAGISERLGMIMREQHTKSELWPIRALDGTQPR
jgi:arylsulfatase A